MMRLPHSGSTLFVTAQSRAGARSWPDQERLHLAVARTSLRHACPRRQSRTAPRLTRLAVCKSGAQSALLSARSPRDRTGSTRSFARRRCTVVRGQVEHRLILGGESALQSQSLRAARSRHDRGGACSGQTTISAAARKHRASREARDDVSAGDERRAARRASRTNPESSCSHNERPPLE